MKYLLLAFSLFTGLNLSAGHASSQEARRHFAECLKKTGQTTKLKTKPKQQKKPNKSYQNRKTCIMYANHKKWAIN